MSLILYEYQYKFLIGMVNPTVDCPIGKCKAGQPNDFSKNGIEGIDPPSRILSGFLHHSSSTALSKAWNQLLSRFPSHQSAALSTVIYTQRLDFNENSGSRC